MSRVQTAQAVIENNGHTLTEVRDFLDDLRERGTVNMFGASPYLQTFFGFDRADAQAVALAYVTEGLR